MIVIYDFDQTLIQPDESYYIQINGEQFNLDMEKMQNFFSDVLAEYGRFTTYEEQLMEQREMYEHLLQTIQDITTLPYNHPKQMDEKEFVLTFLRFLFNINQRYMKRYICENVLMADYP